MAEKLQFYSDKTRRFYQLLPTKTIPTIRISGVPMHRFAKIDPLTDTLLKIKAARPKGVVLDSCMGLGYTAIYSAKQKSVEKVFTFEKDENVLEVAKNNSASSELFTNKKIILENKDVRDAIIKFEDNFFDSIIHDPPTFPIAPELYSENFYKELFRVLKNDGRLWHYCPNPGKLKGKGEAFKNSIKNKLSNAGFKAVYDEDSLGFICRKSKPKNHKKNKFERFN
jgi:hypothetical protein